MLLLSYFYILRLKVIGFLSKEQKSLGNHTSNSIFILVKKRFIYLYIKVTEIIWNNLEFFFCYLLVIFLSVENPGNITILLIIQIQNSIFISLIKSRSRHPCIKAGENELFDAERLVRL